MSIWDKIVQSQLDAAAEHPKLWDKTDAVEIKNILMFYGVHGGLFYHLDDNEDVDAVMCAHPGVKYPDWEWESMTQDWTIFTLWAKTRKAFAEMVNKAMQQKKPDLIYAIRNGQIVKVEPQTLMRLFYGKH